MKKLADEVQLWRARLDDPGLALDDAERVLAPEELRRARRLRCSLAERSFLAARLVLRRLLGAYLEVEPRSVRLTYGTHGKPRLGGEHEGALRVNVAHSEGAALFAFACTRELGVDLERMRVDIAALDIARQFFAAELYWKTLTLENSNGC